MPGRIWPTRDSLIFTSASIFETSGKRINSCRCRTITPSCKIPGVPKSSNPLYPKLCEDDREGNWLPEENEEFCVPFEAWELDVPDEPLAALPLLPPPFVPLAPEYANAELGRMD